LREKLTDNRRVIAAFDVPLPEKASLPFGAEGKNDSGLIFHAAALSYLHQGQALYKSKFLLTAAS
jgi:hypothetical protein